MKLIITGASKGIGKGIAAFLARDGFQVGLVARSGKILEELRATIVSAGGVCSVAPCDLRNPEATHAAITQLVGLMEGVDGLINNAGVVIRKDAFTLSIQEWQAMMETNVNGVFYATRAVLPHLKAQGSGHIINISSISGRLPLAGGSGYAASKHALTGFSDSLLLEARKYGIKVTTVFPGSVDTESHRGQGEDASWKVRPEEVGQACRDLLRTAPGTCVSRLEIRPLKPPTKE
jgi:3-oxoacyl-[acyl-carrier protein] reductase